MIEYGTGKNIMKLPPFGISNKELQDREFHIKIKTRTNQSQLLLFVFVTSL